MTERSGKPNDQSSEGPSAKWSAIFAGVPGLAAVGAIVASIIIGNNSAQITSEVISCAQQNGR